MRVLKEIRPGRTRSSAIHLAGYGQLMEIGKTAGRRKRRRTRKCPQEQAQARNGNTCLVVTGFGKKTDCLTGGACKSGVRAQLLLI